MTPHREPEIGDRVIVVWADIWEVMDGKPEEHIPKVYEAKEGTFLGWHTTPIHHGSVRCDLAYLLVAGGDRDVKTGEERTTVAYPKGCVLSIRIKRRLRKKEVPNGSDPS